MYPFMINVYTKYGQSRLYGNGVTELLIKLDSKQSGWKNNIGLTFSDFRHRPNKINTFHNYISGMSEQNKITYDRCLLTSETLINLPKKSF